MSTDILLEVISNIYIPIFKIWRQFSIFDLTFVSKALIIASLLLTELTMKVFRIQDAEGYGMYSKALKATRDFTDLTRHPMPEEDSLLAPLYRSAKYVQDYSYGFASLEQLRSWVYDDNWLAALHEAGFMLAIFDMEEQDVLVGHTQVMFLRNRCKDVTVHDIVEYFNIKESDYD